jgi:predicted nucleotidyltransferase
MTANAYLLSVIRQNSVPIGQGSYAYKAAQKVVPIVRKWANVYLRAIRMSGSYAKNTAIKGRTDIDIFVSLKSNTKETLAEIFDLLYRWMVNSGYKNARKQNVSVHINQAGVDVDIVPGIKFPGITEDHWLYVKKSGSERIKTNINRHILYVRNSRRINEIKAIKIWCKNHHIDFPSFYLELAVIQAVRGKIVNRIADNVWSVFDYLTTGFVNARFVDPANSNNIISDELTLTEKRNIAKIAAESMRKQYWEDILW